MGTQNSQKTPRRLERVFAFKVLYGLCFSPAQSEAELLRAFQAAPERPERLPEEGGYAWTLVFGVWRHMQELDGIIASFSRNWRLERMGKVEVTLLRIAVFELGLAGKDSDQGAITYSDKESPVPPKVAINEAIELSKQFGDDKSRGFVNGILDAAARSLEK
ncbi:transcription antitermination factor NusB [Desulfovibrio sp. OttesenSCG-928-A18]|nr:transcription antitermination factor NusB [Desulfovibrio sp. OttesenSCG-928-A18]